RGGEAICERFRCQGGGSENDRGTPPGEGLVGKAQGYPAADAPATSISGCRACIATHAWRRSASGCPHQFGKKSCLPNARRSRHQYFLRRCFFGGGRRTAQTRRRTLFDGGEEMQSQSAKSATGGGTFLGH